MVMKPSGDVPPASTFMGFGDPMEARPLKRRKTADERVAIAITASYLKSTFGYYVQILVLWDSGASGTMLPEDVGEVDMSIPDALAGPPFAVGLAGIIVRLGDPVRATVIVDGIEVVIYGRRHAKGVSAPPYAIISGKQTRDMGVSVDDIQDQIYSGHTKGKPATPHFKPAVLKRLLDNSKSADPEGYFRIDWQSYDKTSWHAGHTARIAPASIVRVARPVTDCYLSVC
jgi:hypothetical protein